jgi:hypothetical protein
MARALRIDDTYRRREPGAARPGPRWATGRALDHMLDVKAISLGGPAYRTRAARLIRGGAVESYADGVFPAYRRHARQIDQIPAARGGAGVAPGVVGPCEARLLSYPPTHGLVWGGYAEASGAVHALQRHVAQGIAERQWRSMGARTRAEALGFVTAQVRRRWGIAAMRAQARMRIRRAPLVGAARERRRGEWRGDGGAGDGAYGAADYGGRHARGGGGWVADRPRGGGG